MNYNKIPLSTEDTAQLDSAMQWYGAAFGDHVRAPWYADTMEYKHAVYYAYMAMPGNVSKIGGMLLARLNYMNPNLKQNWMILPSIQTRYRRDQKGLPLIGTLMTMAIRYRDEGGGSGFRGTWHTSKRTNEYVISYLDRGQSNSQPPAVIPTSAILSLRRDIVEQMNKPGVEKCRCHIRMSTQTCVVCGLPSDSDLQEIKHPVKKVYVIPSNTATAQVTN